MNLNWQHSRKFMVSPKSPYKEVNRTYPDRICDAMKRFGETDVARVSALLGISRDNARHILRELVKAKRLIKKKTGFNGSHVYCLPKI